MRRPRTPPRLPRLAVPSEPCPREFPDDSDQALDVASMRLVAEAPGERVERWRLAHWALARRAHRVALRADHAREGPAARRRNILRGGGQGKRQQHYGGEEGISTEQRLDAGQA